MQTQENISSSWSSYNIWQILSRETHVLSLAYRDKYFQNFLSNTLSNFLTEGSSHPVANTEYVFHQILHLGKDGQEIENLNNNRIMKSNPPLIYCICVCRGCI